jgi:hypothetical protein
LLVVGWVGLYVVAAVVVVVGIFFGRYNLLTSSN